MTISYFPTPPTRVDTLNFRNRADAFLSQFNQFVAEANENTDYINGVAVSVLANMNTTIANATAAQYFANAVKWVSGTTYTAGNAVYSPINFQSYRRTTNGAGTTDPSLDATNWVNIQVPIPTIAYDSRATVRGLAPYDGQILFIESVGLMRFFASSTSVDDDETCFSTGTGRWIVECPHWDLIDAMREPDDMFAQFPMFTTFTVAVNVPLFYTGAAITTSQSITVPGVKIGDTVVMAITGQNIISTITSGDAALNCFVTANDTITIFVFSEVGNVGFSGLWNFTITHKNY